MGKPAQFFFRCTHLVHSRFPNHCTDRVHYLLAHSQHLLLLILCITLVCFRPPFSLAHYTRLVIPWQVLYSLPSTWSLSIISSVNKKPTLTHLQDFVLLHKTPLILETLTCSGTIHPVRQALTFILLSTSSLTPPTAGFENKKIPSYPLFRAHSLYKDQSHWN
jgi:hypothetical protein